MSHGYTVVYIALALLVPFTAVVVAELRAADSWLARQALDAAHRRPRDPGRK